MTRLYRKGKLASETDVFTISKLGHANTPREISTRIVKEGNTVELLWNGASAIRYTDSAPLRRGFIGIGAMHCNANFKDIFLHPIPED